MHTDFDGTLLFLKHSFKKAISKTDLEDGLLLKLLDLLENLRLLDLEDRLLLQLNLLNLLELNLLLLELGTLLAVGLRNPKSIKGLEKSLTPIALQTSLVGNVHVRERRGGRGIRAVVGHVDIAKASSLAISDLLTKLENYSGSHCI